MFKAVRDRLLGFGSRLGAAWHDLRGRGLFRLFLFELAVVVIGVLIAQGLASWASERDAQAEMRGAQAKLEGQLVRAISTAHIWEAAMPCMESRITRILSQASSAGTLPGTLTRRPVFYATAVTPLSEDNSLRLQGTLGPVDFDHYEIIIEHSNRVSELGESIAREWVQFSRVDPDYGPVREGDILAAREAAARILSHLRSIAISTRMVVASGEALDMPLIYSLDRGQQVRPLQGCEELGEFNAIYALEEPGAP